MTKVEASIVHAEEVNSSLLKKNMEDHPELVKKIQNEHNTNDDLMPVSDKELEKYLK